MTSAWPMLCRCWQAQWRGLTRHEQAECIAAWELGAPGILASLPKSMCIELDDPLWRVAWSIGDRQGRTGLTLVSIKTSIDRFSLTAPGVS